MQSDGDLIIAVLAGGPVVFVDLVRPAMVAGHLRVHGYRRRAPGHGLFEEEL